MDLILDHIYILVLLLNDFFFSVLFSTLVWTLALSL